jgi:hypothetical protein
LTNCKVLDLDAGTCIVSSTIKIPTGSIVVGEFWTTILGSSSSFSDASNPQPVLQVSYACISIGFQLFKNYSLVRLAILGIKGVLKYLISSFLPLEGLQARSASNGIPQGMLERSECGSVGVFPSYDFDADFPWLGCPRSDRWCYRNENSSEPMPHNIHRDPVYRSIPRIARPWIWIL